MFFLVVQVPKEWGMKMGVQTCGDWTQELRASPLEQGQGLLPGPGQAFPLLPVRSASLFPHLLLSFTLQTIHIFQILGRPPHEAPGSGFLPLLLSCRPRVLLPEWLILRRLASHHRSYWCF